MQARAREPNENISIAHSIRAEYLVFLNASHDETGKIIIGRLVNAGHLRSLATNERATIFQASRDNAGNNLLDDIGIDFAERMFVRNLLASAGETDAA